MIPAITHRGNPVSQGLIDTFWTSMFFSAFDPRLLWRFDLQRSFQTGLSTHICLLSQAMTVFGSKRRELPTLNEGRLPSFAAR